MNATEFINSSGRKVLEYYPSDIFRLDFHFIIIIDKRLRIGYPYLKIENWLTDLPTGIRLLDVWDEGNIIYLKIQELKTSKSAILSHNLDYEGDFWLWSLADYESKTGNAFNNNDHTC